MPEKFYFTVSELRSLGIPVPTWIASWAKKKRPGRFYVRSKQGHKRGGGRLYHIADVKKLNELFTAAKLRFTDEPFIEGRFTWVPRPLLEKPRDPEKTPHSKAKLKYWSEVECGPLGHLLEQREELATFRHDPSSGRAGRKHDFRWTVYHRQDEIDSIEATLKAPPNDDHTGLSEAIGEEFGLYGRLIARAVRDKKLKRRKRRVRTRTHSGGVTITTRPVYPKAKLKALADEPKEKLDPPDPNIWMSDDEATKALSIGSTSMLSDWSIAPKHPTAKRGNERKKKNRGYKATNGRTLRIRADWHLVTRRGRNLYALYYRRKDVEAVAADREKRAAEPFVDLQGEWFRLIPLAKANDANYDNLRERLKLPKPGDGAWKAKRVPGVGRKALAVHADDRETLLNGHAKPAMAPASPNGNGQHVEAAPAPEQVAGRVSGQAPKPVESPRWRHNEDFTEVDWYGTRYTFSVGLKTQIIRVLWEAFEKGGAGLHEKTIGEKVRTDADKFRLMPYLLQSDGNGKRRMHPAWGTMIHRAGERGCFKLAPPLVSAENH